ncbi:hypothetical protein Tco_0183789 [Tanacetum coccineum]
MTQFLRVQFLTFKRRHNFQEVDACTVLKKSSPIKFFSQRTLQDYGTMPIFKRTFSQDLDLLEQHLTKDILSRTDCTTTLTNLKTKFENAFNSEFEERMRKYTRYNAQSFNDAMIYVDTFTRTMLLNVAQLQKQLDKDEFQEDGSMTAFWVVNNQFQKFIDSKFTLDLLHQMTTRTLMNTRGIEFNTSNRYTTSTALGKALDADLVEHKSIRTDSTVQDDNSRSGNDTDTDDTDIRPIYDEEPMAEVDSPHEKSSKKLMAAEKDDISETIVKVDSQMMIQNNDVCSQQFRPQTSMSNDA